MAIKVSQAFERTSAAPIDASIALTKAQMLAVNDNLMPNYYFTICQDDGYIYLYDKSATPTATTGKFIKFEGGSGVPAGGTTGQALVKKSNTDKDVQWSTINGIPAGGTTGQALVKKSNTDKDVQWSTINSIPTGGTTGQVLAKKSNTDRDVEWKNDIPGHTIKNSAATALTQRTNLQLKGVNITDDSTNNTTVVETSGLNSDDWDDVIGSSEISGGYVQSAFNYSTNEQVVGKWIDGKPIYQKTYITTTPSVANSSEDVCPLGVTVDELISLDGIVTLVSSGNKLRYPVNNVIGAGTTWSGDYRACWLRPTTIAMNVSSQCTNLPVHITIRYTKTTD